MYILILFILIQYNKINIKHIKMLFLFLFHDYLSFTYIMYL